MKRYFSKKYETVILSAGGSLIVSKDGIDTHFLSALNLFVRKHIERGRRFFIVVGGGQTARTYRDAGKDVVGELTHEDLDWIGIHATRLNAHLIRTIFQDIAHPRIIENYDKHLTTWSEPVVIGAGWKPGWSTDYDAVILARDYHASMIVNLTNIDWVYTADPTKDKNAIPIKKITWSEFEKLVGTEWLPGTHAPFDPVASQLAKKIGVSVIIANGKNFKNLDKILRGEAFKGTLISPIDVDNTFYDKEYFGGKKSGYKVACYESFFGKTIQLLAHLYRALLIRFLINPKNCLDVGCGTGQLVYFLRKFGIEAYGIDVSEDAFTFAFKETIPYLKKGDITKIPFPQNSFDLVITFDVLEHIERPQLKKAVNETIRVSRKWILHKIYTCENRWITYFHSKDFSDISILSQSFWYNLFRTIDEISIMRKSWVRLPSFIETLFLLRKK